MIEDAVHQLLSESAQRTLETMFFAMPDKVSMDPRRPAGELIAASLTFQGAPPGRFGLVVSDPLARTLAGNFGACDDGVLHRAGLHRIAPVGLREEVLPLRGVVVRGDTDVLPGRIDGAWIDVLIELVVVAVAHAAAQRGAVADAVIE